MVVSKVYYLRFGQLFKIRDPNFYNFKYKLGYCFTFSFRLNMHLKNNIVFKTRENNIKETFKLEPEFYKI